MRAEQPQRLTMRSTRILLPTLFIIFASLALSGCYLFQSRSSYYGIQTDGKGVVFVLDISGSMEGKNEGTLKDRATGAAVEAGGDALGDAVGGPIGGALASATKSEATKLGGAKRELIPAIKGLSDSTSFTLLTFGEDIGGWKTSLVSASDVNKTAAIAYLKGLESGGGTPALEALEEAFKIPGREVIFFVSDGQPTDASAAKILERVKTLNAGGNIVVNTIGLGDDQDEVFLKNLADQNGGEYRKK
jgi:hypothetical protein